MSSFEIKTVQSGAMRIYFNAISKVCKRGTFKIDSTGIKILKQCEGLFIHSKLLSENFESFVVKGVSTITIDLQNLQKITKLIHNNDTLVFKKNENDNFWSLEMNNCEKNTLKIFKIDLIDDSYDEIYIPPLEFETELSIPSCDFKTLLAEMKVLSPKILEIKSIENKLIFKCENEKVSIEYIVGEAENGLKYNLTYHNEIKACFPFDKLLYCIGFTDLCNLIHIYIKKDFPLVIKYDIATLGSLKLAFSPLN